MNREANGGRRARILEIILSVMASAAGSALMIAWYLSATLATYREQLQRHTDEINAVHAEMTNLEARDSLQATQLAVADARFSEILRRLQALDSDGRNR